MRFTYWQFRELELRLKAKGWYGVWSTTMPGVVYWVKRMWVCRIDDRVGTVLFYKDAGDVQKL